MFVVVVAVGSVPVTVVEIVGVVTMLDGVVAAAVAVSVAGVVLGHGMGGLALVPVVVVGAVDMAVVEVVDVVVVGDAGVAAAGGVDVGVAVVGGAGGHRGSFR